MNRRIVAATADDKLGDRKYLEGLIESPYVFPPDDMLAQLRSYKVLSEDEESQWNDLFSGVVQG